MTDPTGLRRYYGNWCGDKWTGGRHKYFEDMTPQEIKNLEDPRDQLDECCMEHDSHLWYCRFMRDQGVFNEEQYRQCENEADRNLTLCIITHAKPWHRLGFGSGGWVYKYGIPFFGLRGLR